MTSDFTTDILHSSTLCLFTFKFQLNTWLYLTPAFFPIKLVNILGMSKIYFQHFSSASTKIDI